MIEEFTISTNKEQELVDVTGKVEELVAKSGVKNGLCVVYVPHATASVTINENADPNITLDIIDALNEAVRSHDWRHDRIDGNAHAHIKSAILGSSRSIPVKDGKLMLGTWQDIFFCEFDGPRSQRRIIVTVVES